jgi:hypothetical protein
VVNAPLRAVYRSDGFSLDNRADLDGSVAEGVVLSNSGAALSSLCQDLRKLAFEAPLVGAHRRAPSLDSERK